MSELFDELPLPGARAIFSTRNGGVSDGPYRSLNLGILTDDQPEHVAENRARLAAAASVDPERVVMGWQVHGAEVREWEGPSPDRAYMEPGGKELPRVDGHATRQNGLGLLVLVADCYPVALSDGRRAAMLHCGWRPLAGSIIEKAVQSFAETPVAAVGPGGHRGGACGGGRARHRRLLLRGRPRCAGALQCRARRRGRTHARPATCDRREASGGGRQRDPASRLMHEL